MKYIRLEYNQEQRCFHENRGKNFPNTDGFYTFPEKCSIVVPTKFVCEMYRRYVWNKGECNGQYPELSVVRAEFQEFLKNKGIPLDS